MDINKIVQYLKLSKPFSIELKSKKNKKTTAHYWGMYTEKNKLHSHLIWVYLRNMGDNERKLETLIAHELIHAWQEENGYTDVHGTSFQMMAANILHEFKIPDIYLPDTDK